MSVTKVIGSSMLGCQVKEIFPRKTSSLSRWDIFLGATSPSLPTFWNSVLRSAKLSIVRLKCFKCVFLCVLVDYILLASFINCGFASFIVKASW